MAITYKDSGVDIEKGDELVEKIKKKAKATCGGRVRDGVGGFAALYDIGNGKLLASGTDGVGTKLKLAQTLGIHDTIGIDLVAMCANDVICTGARPLFFLDYFATGKLDVDVGEQVISGIVDGCQQAEMALIGGETAEMPGMYPDGEYDLAGFCVGEILEKDLLSGHTLKEGDVLIGVASSGVHSNGFSLVRKLINSDETELLKLALTPTKIYVKSVLAMLENCRANIKGLAHITGSGFINIPRMSEKFNYVIDSLPSFEEIPEVYTPLAKRSNLSQDELYKTFNMGVGLVVATDRPDLIESVLKNKNEKFWRLGHVERGTGKISGRLQLE